MYYSHEKFLRIFESDPIRVSNKFAEIFQKQLNKFKIEFSSKVELF